jgi:oxygen-independent coproporphyrinogen-3 oxidase
MSAAGIYVHVPFCRAKCPYCDLYSSAADEDAYDRYTRALLRAIDGAPFDLVADTLYFGGGTPTLLGADRLLKIKDAAAARFGLCGAEITVEANPGTVTPPLFRQLVEGGFSRASFGVQSTDDAVLRTLGRRHSAAQAFEAIEAAHVAGFLHISADLMLAVPGQDIAGICRDVDALAALPVDHISAYILKIEPGTPFEKTCAPPDGDFAADCYLAAAEQCEARGFLQYEISNFAKSAAAQSRHNMKYWRCAPYLGLGPAAHSFADGRRFFFPRDTDAFCRADNPFSLIADDGEGGGFEERVMLGLRLADGIDPGDFPEYKEALLRRAEPLRALGLLREDKTRIALTKKGFLVSNRVIAALLE